MPFDIGDVVPLGITVKDATGTAADATAVACVVTLPDGTLSTASVSHPSTGSYTADFAATATVGRYLVNWAATGTNAGGWTDTFSVRAAADAVVSLADAKAALNITTTTDDDELRDFVAAAQAMVEQALGGPAAPESKTETLDGGTDLLRLTYEPVVSVTSVTVAGSARASTSYAVDGRWIRSLAGDFGSDPGDVVVVYQAGHPAGDPLVRRAVLETLRHLWATQRGSMSGRNPFGGDEYQSAGSGWSMPNRVMDFVRLLKAPGVL